ncbi:polysaccharide deacetylase family protein [Methylopila musalis]|uniref:Chitooligosaccharide deacetylase n=1 Tax=Methylopila musalis TaxID=1134781 RepID=A0ABW3Z5N9_9HYPH
MPPHAALFAAALALAAPVIAAPVTARAADYEPRLTLDVRSAGPRTVALTLDACSGATDLRVLDALIADNVPATFFITRRWLMGNAEAFARMRARPDLFEIENHGDWHVPAITDAPSMFGIPTAGSLDAVRREVEGGARAIEGATGVRPRWYRDATARYSRDALDAIRADGHRIAGFSLNGDMGASLPAAAVARRIAAARNGDVIIAHVNQPKRPAGAGVVEGVRLLKANGARFVRLNDLPSIETDGAPAPGGAGWPRAVAAKPAPKALTPSTAPTPAASVTPR